MSERITLQIAICDDEPAWIASATQVLTQYSMQQELDVRLTTYGSVEELLARSTPCDILFLDILLGTQNGIDVAKALREKMDLVTIIFLTSSADFAMDGYTVGAFRYLLKPLTVDRLHPVIMAYCAAQQQHQKRLLLTCEGEKRLIQTSEILYVMSSLRQLQIVSLQERLSVRDTLQHLFSQLDAHAFAYCNKSCIVHLKHVVSLQKEQVMLCDGQTLPISRRYKQGFVDRLTQYLNQSF